MRKPQARCTPQPTTGAVHRDFRERKKPQRPGSRDAAGRALLDQLVVIRVV